MANDLKITVGNMKKALAQVLPTLPHKMGVVALEFTAERFRQQNWVDTQTKPWKKRKPGSKNNNGRAILMLSGALKRGNRIVREAPGEVVLGNHVKYAPAHNKGFDAQVLVGHHSRDVKKKAPVALTKAGKPKKRQPKAAIATIEVKAHLRHMRLPKRQFIGASPVLSQRLSRMLAAEILKALKK